MLLREQVRFAFRGKQGKLEGLSGSNVSTTVMVASDGAVPCPVRAGGQQSHIGNVFYGIMLKVDMKYPTAAHGFRV